VSVLVQIGHGSQELARLRAAASRVRIDLQVVQFESALATRLAEADVVISHAGAGSILETLSGRAALLVVVNSRLMHDHQRELAEALNDKNHLDWTTPELMGQWLQDQLLRDKPFWQDLQRLPAKEDHIFARMLDSAMGFPT
jgi:beta-1,4-N-acetylglucosaminyltransferase